MDNGVRRRRTMPDLFSPALLSKSPPDKGHPLRPVNRALGADFRDDGMSGVV